MNLNYDAEYCNLYANEGQGLDWNKLAKVIINIQFFFKTIKAILIH